MTNVIEQLKRLLAAERAGVDALSRLVEQAPTSETRTLFSQIRDDEARACAGLVGCLARLGRRPTRAKADFATKVLALPALPDRVRLLNWGQRWVVERIDGLLARDLDKDTRAFLAEMRAVHLRNVSRCDESLVELDRQREVQVDRSFDETPQGIAAGRNLMTERNQSTIDSAPTSLEAALLACGRRPVEPKRVRLVSSALLAALRRTGTAHLYADTADVEELRTLNTAAGGGILAEVDGNTVNQPLAHRVLDRYLTGDRIVTCARELRRHRPEMSSRALLPYLYTMLLGWIGNDIANVFAAGRPWEVSLQLHMGALSDPETARALGRALHAIVPSCFVKVPFRPHEPQSLLIARDLEAQGIPVNFTSTFSARQIVVAALLADVTRTNIFMGRLNQGFRATLLGEHVDLEAQRALLRLRGEAGAKTQLIVASVREWETFVRVAGCDVFTAPCEVLGEFLAQTDVPPEALTSQLETSYEDRIGIADEATRAVGRERIARLWQVEPGFLEFLTDYRASAEYRGLGDGERLRRRFEEAGFGDFFYAPDVREWQILRKSKLPDLAAPLAGRLAADTHMSLLADGDFVNQQEAIDAALLRRVAAPVLYEDENTGQGRDRVPGPRPFGPPEGRS